MRHSRSRPAKATDPFEFAWKVPATGYRLVRARLFGAHRATRHATRGQRTASRMTRELADDDDRPVLCLTDGVETGQPVGRVRRYKLFTDRFRGLFLEFAGTARTEAGILDFAHKNGSLLGPTGPLVVPATSDTGRPVHAEELGL